MVDRWQDKMIAHYIRNILSNRTIGGDWLNSLINHICDEGLLGDSASRQCQRLMAGDEEAGFKSRRRRALIPNRPKVRAQLKSSTSELLSRLAKAKPDDFEQNLRTIADGFDLDASSVNMLRLLLLTNINRRLRDMVDCVSVSGYGDNGFRNLAAILLDCDTSEVDRSIGSQGILLERGLIALSDDYHSGDFTNAFKISRELISALVTPVKTYDSMLNIILGAPSIPSIQWSDFEHLGENRDRLKRLLGAAVRLREPGINILLYGPPGTGKTEFSRALAEAVGASLYQVGESGDKNRCWRGEEPDRSERLLSLRLTQRLLARDHSSMILFDEMEDVVERPSPFRAQDGSRVYLHRLLENNQTPTIWTCNDVAGLPQPTLRRMTMAIEVRAPAVAARIKVWRRILEKHEMPAEESLVRRLAIDFEAAPGLAEQAVRACRLAGEPSGSLPDFVHGIAKVMRGGSDLPPKASPWMGKFNPLLTNADIDAVTLLEQLSSTGLKPYSLCLSGPPGTGKTAFASELAHRLEVPVIRKRASDLLSMWVGGSERNIADAFSEARDSRAVLVIDEADSLLGDRRHASQSWEVSQVNEMLTWMEVHPLPFICTTNLMDRVDAASLRRFTFKIEFGFLRHDQIGKAFNYTFGLEAPDAAMALEQLTPGDFSVVRRKAELIGGLDDPSALTKLLAAEVTAKVGRRITIGFGRK